MRFRHAARTAVIVAALLCIGAAAFGQIPGEGWPKFRGNVRNTGLSPYSGPNLAAFDWSYPTGAAISSSPSVGPDGTVYVASQDQKLYAFNSSGTVRWQVNIGSTGNCSPTVAADGTIYVGSENYFIYAISPTGTIKWQKGVGKQIKSSPTVGSDGTVYFGAMNGKVYAYSSTGTALWGIQTGNPVASSPALGSDGTVYVGSEDQYLYAIDPTGFIKWRYFCSGWVDSSPSVGPDGTVYVASGDGRLYAINYNGTLKWNYLIGSAVRSSTAIGPDGTIYVGADDKYLYAFNANGTLKWRYLTADRVQSSPAVGSDGVVYVASLNGHLYAVNPDGTLLWDYTLGGYTNSSPAIAPDGALYIGCNDTKLYSFAKDRTPPTTPVVTDDGVFTTNATTLHATWTTDDPDTGLLDIKYAIGTTPGGTDVVDWTSVGLAMSVTRTGLTLVNGKTYYFSVKAQNGVHNWSAVGVSDGITLDTTVPQTPVVTDDGEFSSATDALHAAWQSVDAESGIVAYQYCIGTAPGLDNVRAWASAGTATEATVTGLPLGQGVTYYFTAKSLNGAGFWSANGTSNGITIDRTAPPAPVVTDDGPYSPSNTSLHISWTGADPESGAAEYLYSIGTAPGATDVLDWTSAGTALQVTRSGLSLVDGLTYYAAVKIRNKAGLWGPAGVTDGIIIDGTVPTTPVVTDDGQYSSSGTTLHATWTSSDPNTGIAEYQYAIGTTSGATDAVPWTSTGTTASVTRTGLTLYSGLTYYISVKAKNLAGGWSAVGASDGIVVDLTPPLMPVVVDDGQYTSSSSSLHASWTATDAESGVVEYQYALGTTAGGSDVVAWTSAGTDLQVTKTGLALADGGTYYFSVKAKNRVGMWSSAGSSDGIVVDFSGPTTPSVTDDGDFTASSNTLHAVWSATDPRTGIIEYQYAVGTTPGGTETLAWTSAGAATEVTKTGLVLSNSITYYISVKAKSGSGVWSSAGTSNGIVVDLTPPSAPTVTDDGQYTSDNTSLHASWTATDAESGIADYQYAIGTTAGGTDVAGWTLAGNVTQITRTGLSLTDGATYYITVKARNRAGAWGSAGTSDGIMVDHSAPSTPAVVDDGDYTAVATQIHASWSSTDAQSGIAEYQYAVGTSAGASDVVVWTSTGTVAQATATGLALSDGTTYYVSVKARNRAGLWSIVGVSDGIMVDASAPAPPVVTDDGDYTWSNTTLHASWAATDPHSGIIQYQYAVGTTPGGTNIVAWTSTGTATEVTKAGLFLTHGQTYYFSVKAKNRAGLWSDAGTSNGITVDLTGPSAPSVTDDGDYTSSSTTLHATWSSTDAESGIAEYQYAIGTVAGGTTIVPWTSAGSATEITKTGLILTSGFKYYVSVKAKNGAGVWGNIGASDGITVDTTPPGTPTVTDDGAFTTSSTTLHASWTAADAESGIGEYQYAIGTVQGGTDVLAWTSAGTDLQVTRTDLSLTDGVTYYFSVKAKNRAGLWGSAGYSDGILADSTPPSVPVVVDDGFTPSNTSLHATWSSSDPHSGITLYQYAIGTTPGATNVVAWTSAGTLTEVTRSGLLLTHGATYFISVKARNGAGAWSSVGTSGGVVIDLTAPATPTVTDDGDYTSQQMLHASWTSGDSESGIAEYQYALGTSRGGTDVVGWTSAGTAIEISRNDLTLTSGIRYYFAVKARNRAGTWSIVGTSDGIVFDTTPPPAPTVTDDGQYTTSNSTLHAVWSGTDAESGVAEYLYAIGTAPGDTSVAGWTSAGTATSATRSGLSLIDGVTYYVSVKVKNRAGLTGAEGASDGIMVDSSAPTTPVVHDDGYTDSTNTLHATWSATDPHSGVAEYQYAVGTSPGTANVVAWTSVGTSTEVTKSGLLLFHNQTYYFEVKAKNSAGLWSVVGNSAGVLVDQTAPPAPVVTDDGQYTTNGISLHVTWTGTDPESGISEFLYAVGTTSGGTDVLGWTSAGNLTSATISGLQLVDGTKYYVAVQARNRVGRLGPYGVTDGIIVDSTPPTVPVVTDDGAYATSLDTLHAKWTAADPHTGVVEYQYAIGTSAGGADIVGWTSVGTLTEVTKTGLTLTGGNIYYFSVKARNAAGGWSAVGVSDGIMTDRTPPTTPVIVQDSRYTSNTTTLHASWSSSDPESGVVEYQYAVGTTAGGSDVAAWSSSGTAAEATLTGLTLTEGTTYYFAVKARNKVLLWSEVGVAVGITVDTSGPTVSAVNDDGDYTLSLDTLHATWVAFDAQSGVVEYQYCIGTTAGAADVAGWTSVGSLTDVTAGGLALTDGGTYYFAVRAKNGAGLWGSVGVSDGITVAISAAWPKFRNDNGNHGVSRFFGSKVGALLWQFPTSGWVESSPALSGDGTVYIGSSDGSVYAISRQGAMVWSYTTGGPIDSSPAISKDGTIYVGSYDSYLYCLSGGTCKWKFKTGDMIWSSPVIGPDDTIYFGCQDGYFYALRPNGTLKWKQNVGTAVWSSPALSDTGVLYFGAGDGYVYALSASDGTLVWRYQTGTAVDSSPSIAADGTVYAGSGDGYFYAINPDGTLKWRFYNGGWAVDSSAAVAKDGTVYVGCGQDWYYGVLYAFEPNGTLKWSLQANGEVRSSPAVSSDGLIYFGSGDGNVYAVNTDGTVKWTYNTHAPVLSSPSIGRDGRVVIGSYSGYVYTFKDTTVDDTTPPTRPTVVDEGAVTISTSSLAAAWTSNDPESGIAEYVYAIGTWPGTDDVCAWTSAGTSTSVTKTDLSLQSGVTYYFSIKAMNGGRMWSPVGVSDGIEVVSGQAVSTIGAAKKLADQTVVNLMDKVVTARFDGVFYIEEPDRSAGIKVFTQGLIPPVEGTKVAVAGTMMTDNGERGIRLNTVEPQGAAVLPLPLGMPNINLCGGPPVPAGPGVTGGTGVNSTGLLVLAWGRVTSVGTGYFFMDDGSGVVDPSGAVGVKVSLTGLFDAYVIFPPAVGDYVRVTGIASVEPAGTGYRRVLRPRFALDTEKVQ